ncbi:hypothetical protein [Taibaiella koreensis]|uniref:hypothetical protein n=1 Tax=Taibaiella koreensis TaxID=1268548 RepID=UPI000E59B2A0|nr:hypothetical protein [Taibaiella koreensis]
MKKTMLHLGILAACALTLGSCSKDNNPLVPTGTKNIKFTFSTPGIKDAEGDAASFNLAGSDGSGDNTLWKVNGQVRSNEQGFIIAEEELEAGGTFVIESVKPLMAASLSISAQNFGATSYTLKYKAEVNGTVQNDVTENIVSSNGYIKQFSY